jgi:mannose/fructose-specific phosphotransferase system component IIA
LELLIVTHRQLAEALLSASDLIWVIWKKWCILDPSARPDYANKLAACKLNGTWCVSTDMFGGTPSNLSLLF